MADQDVAEVEVPEEGTVEVPLEGGVAPAKKADTEPKPEAKTKPEGGKVQTKEPAAADEATKALQTALDNERRLRQAAEQTATGAVQQANQERTARLTREQELEQERETAQARELTRIESDIANSTSLIASTQKELSAALAEGNFEKVAEVQTRLSRATAALDRHEARKEDFENRATKAPVTEGRVTEQQGSAVQGDPFERYIAGFEPAAQTWLRAHRECAPESVVINGALVRTGGKADMNAKMMRGHYDALSQGYAPNSDDYFRVIEESTGYRQPVTTKPTTEEMTTTQTKTEQPKTKEARPSAPPSREVPGSPPTGTSRTVRLSREEQEAARFSFPNLEPAKAYAEYAKNKVALDAEGKLGRTSH